VAGAILLFRRERKLAALLVVASAGFVAAAEAFPSKPYPFFARYVLPALPALAVLASVACARLAAVARADRHRSAARWAAIVALALLLVSPLVRSARFVAAMEPDTRDVARDWLRDALPDGARLLTTPYGPILAGARPLGPPS